MLSQNQVQQLLIGKSSVNLTAVGTVGLKPQNMTAGEIGAFTKGGAKYVEASAATGEANAATGADFILYKKAADGSVFRSETLNKSMIEKVIRKDTSAAAEKVESFGYNGTDSTIETLDETMYRINIMYKEGFTNNDHGVGYYKHAIYKSDASATQAEIAIGLAGSGASNFAREPKNSSGDAPIRFKAICNVAASATNDLTNAATITKGSKVFSVATALTYNGTASTLAVGDFLRIAANASVTDLATNNSTTRAYAVYKVTAINSLAVTVDRPIDHMTANITVLADADDAIQVIPAATGIAADWGVVLYGSEQDFTVGKKAYKKVDWESSIEGTDNTTKTSITAVSAGINVYEQIAEMEWFLQGNEGNFYRASYPVMENPRAEVEDTGYETIEIIYNTTVPGLINTTPNRKVLTIALPTSNPGFWTNGTDGLADVLEVLLTGVPIYGGLVTASGGALAAGDLN